MKAITKLTKSVFLFSTSYFLTSTLVFAQGSLTPPGAPSPTFKTLQQIEPRTDLQASPAPAGVDTSNSAYHFIINQPGSYYLSANLGVTKTNGIQINAEGVTLDLNGFQVSRSSGSGGDGIEISATSHRASIRNGSIKGFQNGIDSIFSSGNPARGCLFRDLAVSNCTSNGIFAGEGSVLDGCRAHNNSGNAAFFADDGSTFTNCTATNNSAQYGINASDGCSLMNCAVSDNTPGTLGFPIHAASGSTLFNCTARNNTSTHGIATDSNCLLTNCSAVGNTSPNSDGILALDGSTVINCVANFNAGVGFRLGDGCTLQGCTASTNQGNGILAGGSCLISNCVANSSGKKSTPNNTAADGIQIGSRNRVVGCTVFSNANHGIDCTSTSNRNYIADCLIHSNGGFAINLQPGGASTVIRNQVGGNTGGTINPATGQDIAPIQDASNAATTPMHPFANFP